MTNEIKDKLNYKIRQAINQNANQNENTFQGLPENPVETAHILIDNSELTRYMPEVDKEIKLSNLDFSEKQAIYLFTEGYYSLKLLEFEQYKKLCDYYNLYQNKLSETDKKEIVEQITAFNEKISNPDNKATAFDKANALRRGQFIATLSRGKFGFERTKQVETIANYRVENIDKTEQTPGFLKKAFSGGFGGFKKNY